ncbi:LruC domain-containing protein [Ferrimonas sp. SCSIO 43195]|uniref:LruC domain-containing protein n=1 Tax=Ferrimonas sp. SCSIO 43195 TaxID=2822844 RepID=UPI002075AA62|nr:LruC domain-containing protein [Ferrimonas sp. SCSIO 43195]USD38814.1 LruC domain-containing protein [Ferrimonas sp. SCSIO 43195]
MGNQWWLLGAMLATQAQGAAFTSCPTEAYLFQKDTVVYGVDLVTGAYEELSDDLGIPGNVNGIGFNETDRYIYGFSKHLKDVVQVDSDYQATALNVTGLPSGVHFFVGDVHDDTYWIYHRNHGLFSVSLDETSPQYLQAQKVVGADTSMVLTDFAFHPSNQKLYAVDNSSGDLYQIDITDGSRQVLGNSGITGTFGAGYFEKSGYYYLSRNQDGHIFRIDLRNPEQLDASAEFFAYGPASSSNDGARCASADVIPVNVDFGDAPASYGTRMEDNGARHALGSQGPILGANADADSDGFSAPWSDDLDGLDDEDGVAFVTAFEAGTSAVIQVEVTQQIGYLQGFIDWNQDGVFAGADEQVITDRELQLGSTSIAIAVPATALGGVTQARFRIASDTGLGPKGGAADGEVEDYAVAISTPGSTTQTYPNEGEFASIAFEDRWPFEADYDMNDVVMDLQITEYTQLAKVTKVVINGKLQALGAEMHSGFAIHLPQISRSNIDVAQLEYLKNGVAADTSTVLETGQSDAVLIISEDLFDEVTVGCGFYRTQAGCDDGLQFQFQLTLVFAEGVDPNAMPAAPYDPFIFASPNRYRTGFDTPPGRQLEIHLADFPPTDLGSSSYFGTFDDDSNPGSNRYYRNSNSLPWGLQFPQSWHYPAEKQDLLQTYPQFQQYIEYDGGQYLDWYHRDNANAVKLFN